MFSCECVIISTCLISTCFRVEGRVIRRGFRNLCCRGALLGEGSRDILDPCEFRVIIILICFMVVHKPHIPFHIPKTEMSKNIYIHWMLTLIYKSPEILAFTRPQKVDILEQSLKLKLGNTQT